MKLSSDGITHKKWHLFFGGVLFSVALLFNSLPWILTGIPLSQQLSSDAEYHVVHWQEFSKKYEGNFKNDVSFQYDVRPAGDLFVDKIFVRVGDYFSIPANSFSIFISVISLVIFLLGVYALSFFVLRDAFLAFIMGIGSIIPTFTLGGTTWGFQTLGYIPRELALGFCVWLLLLFLYAKKQQLLKLKGFVFLVTGLLANWYPVNFFHLAVVLLLTEIILDKKILKEHLLHGVLFVCGASFAILDVLSKAGATIAPDLAILHIRYSFILLSTFSYAVFRYLRRAILYLIWIPILLSIEKRFLKETEKDDLLFWKALFISSGILMSFGVLLDQYTVYAKFAFSRTANYFFLAAMFISVIVVSATFAKRWPGLKGRKYIVGLILLILFIGQSSLPTVYPFLRDAVQTKERQKVFFDALQTLGEHTSSTDMILATTRRSNMIRAYASRPVYSSWKDGGIALLDGVAGKAWYERFLSTNQVLQTNDINKIMEFSKEQGISTIFLEKDNVSNLEGKYQYVQAGDYRIIPVTNR